MHKEELQIDGVLFPLYRLETAVVGSGCAGFNAADWLFDYGHKDVVIFTEGLKMGTSRNTGSDKQTYYKLSLSGSDRDSVGAMAETLCRGGDVHGDTALCEAAGSVRSFIKLANLGVPFPTNEYGEYVGYKTDHDPRQRATSAGPLTSKFMTEALEQAVFRKGIPVLDHMTVVELLVRDGAVQGFLCLDHSLLEEENCGLCVVLARQVILATGGPAACYRDSVYPHSQTGMSGMALAAGAKGANLHEWQYGLASTAFRWNVSGTYQQVLPRYISVDAAGVEREFLTDAFAPPNEMLSRVFLKGYQWPFDTEKIDGSSLIDLLVYRESILLGRRVFMDYRRNPTGLETAAGFRAAGEEAFRYLSASLALQATPIERLAVMNPPAIALYKDHGIDLYTEPLEIGVCAQHHNGGLWVDKNWETNIRGLYAVGEVAGTFGAYRPGGSALNSTQVGSQRAAEHIAFLRTSPADSSDSVPEACLAQAQALWEKLCRVAGDTNAESNVKEQRVYFSSEFSRCAAFIRSVERMAKHRNEIEAALVSFFETAKLQNPKELIYLLKNRDILISQEAILSAMISAAEILGSRGSALIEASEGLSPGGSAEILRYKEALVARKGEMLVTIRTPEGFVSGFEKVRPLPESGGWFENVWAEFRARGGSGREDR